MPEVSTTAFLTCPSCGHTGPGKYCSYCGRPYHEEGDPYKIFAKSLFNLDGILRYLKLYGFILKKPVANTISTFQKLRLEDAVKFMEYSLGIAVVFSGTGALFKNVLEKTSASKSIFEDLIVQLLVVAYLVVSYFFIMKLFYRYASKKYGQRNKTEYIKMYCMFAGFTLPVFVFFYQILGGMLFYNIYILRLLATMTSSVLILLYGAYIWQYFWDTKDNRLIFYLMKAGGIVLVVSAVLVLLVFWAMDKDLPG
jgi:hypothetical protein